VRALIFLLQHLLERRETVDGLVQLPGGGGQNSAVCVFVPHPSSRRLERSGGFTDEAPDVLALRQQLAEDVNRHECGFRIRCWNKSCFLACPGAYTPEEHDYTLARSACGPFRQIHEPMRLLKPLLAVVSALAVVGAVAIYADHADREITTDILIHASPQAVWQTLTATSEYPSWNPMINRINGELRAGNVIEVDEGMVFHPTVLVMKADQELRWKGHVWIPGIFDGEHRFVLEAHGENTRLIQSERFTGILAGRLTRGVIDETVDAMQDMNRALKARVETREN
jgi:hypothetical protein